MAVLQGFYGLREVLSALFLVPKLAITHEISAAIHLFSVVIGVIDGKNAMSEAQIPDLAVTEVCIVLFWACSTG
jgi:hypothetical protein